MDVIFWTGVYSGNRIYRAIGAYQLAHWLRSHGYTCQVIDFIQRMTSVEIIKYTEKFITKDTLCLGLSSTFWANWNEKNSRWETGENPPKNILDALIYIKEKYPHIKIVLGGSQADSQNSRFTSLVDNIVIGESEDILLEILDNWRKNKRMIFSTYRYNTPVIKTSNQKKFFIEHCNHKFINEDCIIEGETLPIEIGRGCIFSCKFCSYINLGKKKNDYIRRMELIQEEINHNYKNYKTTNYFILDDTFNDSKDKILEWNTLVKNLDFKINYTGYIRADLLSRHEEQIDIFKETGLLSAFFGIESLNKQASYLVGKPWSGKEAKSFLPELKKYWGDDTTIHMSLIVGIPPETVEDYKKTQEWLIENSFESWYWQCLRISDSSREFTSEFERNYEKFGFRISDNNQSIINKSWETDFLNLNQAMKLSTELNLDPRKEKITKYAHWDALSLMSLGFDKKTLNHKYSHLYDKKDITLRSLNFIKKYKDKLSSL